jgi:large conductance mechanosensitive channel
MLLEFKKFAMRGNVMDMAVGIIIGAAFGKIVDSLVKDIIMPPLGLILGKIDFANLFFVLQQGKIQGPYASLEAAKAAGAITLNAGSFLNTIISFIIVAFAVFMVIKAMNAVENKVEGADKKKQEVTTKACPYCVSSIPLKATKCAYCTADLPEQKAAGSKKK